MFLEFYRLRQQPFGVTPDPAYLYRTRTHREALDSLLSGIKEGRGFFSLIAEPGMGKTTVLYQLLDELHDCARTVFLFQTQCDSREFFQYVLNELGIDTAGMALVAMHAKLNEILFSEMIAGRRFVLVVDEAQNLESSVLETVRLLSNFETSYAKMLQIVLAGQPELADKLAQPHLAQLRQRLAVTASLEALSCEETGSYIEHRLAVAGYSGAPLFTSEAVALIAQRSHGIPRTINHLCYSALSLGHTRQCETISSEIVSEVLARLDGLPFAGHKKVQETQQAPVVTIPVLASDPAPREEKQQESSPTAASGFLLTYEPARQFRLPRWAARMFLLTGILLLGGISLTAFMLRLTEPTVEKRAPDAVSVKGSSAVEPADLPGAAPAQPVTDTQSGGMSYSADPEETGDTQIITVAVMPGQKIEDISTSYVGKFDADLLQQIRALNPEIKDTDHLSAGQLIRLPLPRGSFRKGQDFDEK